jgi:tRNA G18 (ribose-2'-O)-methylase SpoU
MKQIRELTRKQRYYKKLPQAKFLPVELCTVNFKFDQNLGFLIRAAACFGVRKINVIGTIPNRKELNKYSGTLCDWVILERFSNPSAYLKYVKEKGGQIIAAEISDASEPIDGFDFSNIGDFHLVVGNEHSGVPTEILFRSAQVHVPMPGVGFCLNTSQAANVFLYEISKQINQTEERNCA